MEFVSLFAGIGGFDLGLERAGMTCVAQVEIDPFCQRVLAKHWPDVPRFGDIRDVGIGRKHELPPAQLICGGFPCQPHSLAGKRGGASDDRDLWPEYRRLIDEYRYPWVLGENVLGIRTTILDAVLSDLEGLGYAWRTFVVPAAAFNAPHRRDRLFVVGRRASTADANGIGRPPEWVWCAQCRKTERVREEYISGNAREDVSYAEQIGRRRGRDTSKENYPKGQYAEKSGQQRRRQEFGIGANGSDAGDAAVAGFQDWTDKQVGGREPITQPERPNWWAVEPDVGRVAHGVSNRVDRLRSLGNAVVPQVVEWFGRIIIECDNV